jgi:hypothetical protein
VTTSKHHHKNGEPVQWQPGGRSNVLEVYVRLHDDKLIGEHWLWAAVTRVALHKEPIDEVLADYGYAPTGNE